MAPKDDDQPPKPATGDAMIELPSPPSFSLTHDPAGGIRLAGEVPDDDTRNPAKIGRASCRERV